MFTKYVHLAVLFLLITSMFFTAMISMVPTSRATGPEVTTTAVSCSPSSVAVNVATECTAEVSGASNSLNGQMITFGSTGQGAFSPAAGGVSASTSCTLNSISECFIFYTPTSTANSPQTIIASYEPTNASEDESSQGTTPLTVTGISTTTTLMCAVVGINVNLVSEVTCTVTLAGFTGSINGEPVTFSSSGAGTFSATECIVATDICGVSYFPVFSSTSAPSEIITASYAGDAYNPSSQGTYIVSPSNVILSGITEGFDGYDATRGQGSNIANYLAPPWDTEMTDCFFAHGEQGTYTPTTAAGDVAAPVSPPNIYQFEVSSRCEVPDSYENMTIPIVPTLSSVSPIIGFYINLESSALDGPGEAQLTVRMNSSSVGTIDLYTLTVGTWNHVYFMPYQRYVAGETVMVAIDLTIAMDSPLFRLWIDNVVFTNGAPLVNNPAPFEGKYNFGIVDYSTGQFADTSLMVGSYLTVDYTQSFTCDSIQNVPFSAAFYVPGGGGSAYSQDAAMGEPPTSLSQVGASCILTSLGVPDMIIPQMGYSDLITLDTGTYSRSIIPCVGYTFGTYASVDVSTCNQATMYVDSPASVLNYIITVADLSNTITSGSLIFIYRGGALITSGSIDAQNSFSTALVPNVNYQVMLVDPSGGVTTTSFTTSASSLSVTLPFQSIKINVASGISDISTGAVWACANTDSQYQKLIVQYDDVKYYTTHLVFDLMQYNSTSPSGVVMQSQSVSGTNYGAVTIVFTGVDTTVTSELGVSIFATRVINGLNYTVPLQNLNTFGIGNCGSLPSLFPQQANFPSDVMGMFAIFPYANAWLYVLSLFILFVTAAIFGARGAGLGGVFVSLEAFIFLAAGWLPPVLWLINMFVAVMMISFLIARRNKG